MSAATEYAIEVSGVSRAFGKVQAVRDASLSVPPGGVTALIGPNGSGKTTLMLMLATLLQPDSGSIRIGGHDALGDTRLARATLGWMPDALGVWETLTVREALQAVAAMYGLRGPAATSRVTTLLAATGLDRLASQRTQVLSRGQKQRLSLARALVHEPQVLLLDEPASGLDPEARVAQRQALAELAASGVAILITSHVLDELEQLATEVVFLRDGTTESPQAVSAALRPATAWRIRGIDPERLGIALTALGVSGTTTVGLGGERSTVVEVVDEAAAADLLARLAAVGAQVIEFGPAAGRLEQAFVRLQDPGWRDGQRDAERTDEAGGAR